MGLYTPIYNCSSADHQYDTLLSLVHAVHTLALYNIQVGMIQCRSRIRTQVLYDACYFCRNSTSTFYYTDESLSQLIIHRITNFYTFIPLVPILCMIICNNIIPGVYLPINLWFKYRFTIMSKIKEPIVNFI